MFRYSMLLTIATEKKRTITPIEMGYGILLTMTPHLSSH